MERALVLNASDEPLGITGSRRAAVLALSQKADILVDSGYLFHSATEAFSAPSVIRLRQYVHVPYRRPSNSPTLAGLKARDGQFCAYCVKRVATTIDHVRPRSRGGAHAWENTVACCTRCNARKAARTVKEAGFVLHVTPRAPTSTLWLTLAMAVPNPKWAPFLEGLGLDDRYPVRELVSA
jgi:5-methylcytosine-specific restriction endonuclease McrA